MLLKWKWDCAMIGVDLAGQVGEASQNNSFVSLFCQCETISESIFGECKTKLEPFLSVSISVRAFSISVRLSKSLFCQCDYQWEPFLSVWGHQWEPFSVSVRLSESLFCQCETASKSLYYQCETKWEPFLSVWDSLKPFLSVWLIDWCFIHIKAMALHEGVHIQFDTEPLQFFLFCIV